MTAENRKIRWGVLGYARIARESLIPAMQRASNSGFYAIASREESKLAECRSRFNVPRTYRGYDELVRDPDVDAVYIPLPNSQHCKWTIKAAENGKHVLCEKPLALNVLEAREMIAACAANKVRLMEAFMYRYTDRTRKVLDVLRSNVLGEIKYIGSTFRFMLANPASIKLKPELGGGALYDVGCYPVNFIGMVLDEITKSGPGKSQLPESVTAESVWIGGVDMSFSALMKYSSGLIASVNCGLNSQKRIFSEIIGTKGALEIPDTFFDNAGVLALAAGEERRDIQVDQSDRYRLEVEDFADAILKNRAPHFSLAETIRNLEVMDKLFAVAK
jgi:predicted dehydrogenase